MAEKPIKTPLPADLPEDWNAGQIVAPDGTTVGLTEQHGYNYLMKAVNRAQSGVNAVNEAFETVSGKRTCRFVVGTSTAGWTEADCDFLCDGVDDQVEIQQAIDALPGRNGGEIVILSGIYHLTDRIKVENNVQSTVLRGNGKETCLSRDVVSTTGSSKTKDAIIEIDMLSELRDMSIISSVDAPGATQIYSNGGANIINVNINTSEQYAQDYGKKGTEFGIFVCTSVAYHFITGCFFGNVITAILLGTEEKSVGLLFIGHCKTIDERINNIHRFVPYFVRSYNIRREVIIEGNSVPMSTIQLDCRGNGNIISNNIVSVIDITNANKNSPLTGNLISGNVLLYKDETTGITLGENTGGWFVTGNQIRNPNTENGFFPITDYGIKNDIRFNSNDSGGSTPATVQQATPTVSVNADGTVTATATQAAGYVAAGTRSATHQLSSADDTDLKPENIKDGVSIFGVQGTLQTEGGGTAGVSSFNGRSGAVVPGSDDYTAEMVGAIPAESVKAFQVLTEAEYNALTEKSATTLYLIKE